MDPSRGKGGLLSGPLGEGGQGMRPTVAGAPLSRPLGGKALEDLPPFWKGCGRSATEVFQKVWQRSQARS